MLGFSNWFIASEFGRLQYIEFSDQESKGTIYREKSKVQFCLRETSVRKKEIRDGKVVYEYVNLLGTVLQKATGEKDELLNVEIIGSYDDYSLLEICYDIFGYPE